MREIWLIAALDKRNAIGEQATNSIPWRLPGDLRHFRELTIGHIVVMGRKTYESIGKALPQRTNIVLTRNPTYRAPGCLCLSSISAVFDWFDKPTNADMKLCIIGGSTVYEAFLPYATQLCLTRVQLDNRKGDIYFPDVDLAEWQRTKLQPNRDKSTSVTYVFETWQRASKDI